MSLKLFRGLKANLPTLTEGEIAWVTDDKELYVGSTASGNILINAAASGLTDAPSDGTTYGRKDGGWVDVGSAISDTDDLLEGSVNLYYTDVRVSANTDVDANTAARHAELHTVASHSDTTATGAELDELTDGSTTALHNHISGGTSDNIWINPTVGENVGGGVDWIRFGDDDLDPGNGPEIGFQHGTSGTTPGSFNINRRIYSDSGFSATAGGISVAGVSHFDDEVAFESDISVYSNVLVNQDGSSEFGYLYFAGKTGGIVYDDDGFIEYGRDTHQFTLNHSTDIEGILKADTGLSTDGFIEVLVTAPAGKNINNKSTGGGIISADGYIEAQSKDIGTARAGNVYAHGDLFTNLQGDNTSSSVYFWTNVSSGTDNDADSKGGYIRKAQNPASKFEFSHDLDIDFVNTVATIPGTGALTDAKYLQFSSTASTTVTVADLGSGVANITIDAVGGSPMANLTLTDATTDALTLKDGGLLFEDTGSSANGIRWFSGADGGPYSTFANELKYQSGTLAGNLVMFSSKAGFDKEVAINVKGNQLTASLDMYGPSGTPNLGTLYWDGNEFHTTNDLIIDPTSASGNNAILQIGEDQSVPGTFVAGGGRLNFGDTEYIKHDNAIPPGPVTFGFENGFETSDNLRVGGDIQAENFIWLTAAGGTTTGFYMGPEEISPANVPRFYYDTADQSFKANRVILTGGLGSLDTTFIDVSDDIRVDTIDELTPDAGVTVDGLLIKDGGISGYDSHVASTSNPHSVTKTQVGLSNVTNDKQLTTGAGQWATEFSSVTAASADVLLIEDASLFGAKKRVLVSSLPVNAHTQAASTITDFNTAVAANSAVAANTAHAALTDEHIDWTAATDDLVTTGDVTATDYNYGTAGVARTKIIHAGEMLGSHNWTNAPSYASSGSAAPYIYMLASIADPVVQWVAGMWPIPADWKTGTAITVELCLGTSSGSTTNYNYDIEWDARLQVCNTQAAPTSGDGREYATWTTETGTLTDQSLYVQTAVWTDSFTITADGDFGSASASPGDYLVIQFGVKPSATSGGTSTTLHANMIKINYTATSTKDS